MQANLKLLIILASTFFHFSCPSLSLPNSTSSEVLSPTERRYMNWVKHMGFASSYKKPYQSQLHKSVKKKRKKKNRHHGKRKCRKCPSGRVIRVSKDPREGEFGSVQEAIDSLPLMNSQRVVISISAGTYKEKVEVATTMENVSVEGEGAESTVIEWDDTADKLGQSGQPLGTFASATFAVNAPYFVAKNLTFKVELQKVGKSQGLSSASLEPGVSSATTSLSFETRNTAPPPPSGALGKQAVAMRVSADKAAFIGCNFIGAQDTLYDHKGRHYFKECYIQGSIDFIFGNGLSLYEGCHLHAAANTSYGALTAQKRESMLEETGFSFVRCKVTGFGVLYLGRAWGTFSRVVFAYTYMDKIITPTGWYDWGDKNRHMTVFYGQYKCSGPGANYGARVACSRELTTEEVAPFVTLDFVDGYSWLKYVQL